MFRLICLMCFGGLLSTQILAQPVDEKSCRKVVKQIKLLEQQMRQGYTIKKGEQLKKRMRKLKKQRYLCHKARFPTK